MSTTEKLQKVLARIGLGSRREIESWIEIGRIKVNNEVAHVGQRVSIKDTIRLDNRLIKLSKTPVKTRILMYHKDAGLLCTRSDPQGRPTVFDDNPKLKSKRWVMIGRLDFNTAGLLLFTNNGELANKLMHPSSEFEREYAVRLHGELSLEHQQKLTSGVRLEDGIAKFEWIKDAGGTENNHWYHVVLKEGRNREVRRMFESVQHQVTRLIRVRYGHIQLPPWLRKGQVADLKDSDIKLLEKDKL